MDMLKKHFEKVHFKLTVKAYGKTVKIAKPYISAGVIASKSKTSSKNFGSEDGQELKNVLVTQDESPWQHADYGVFNDIVKSRD